MLHTVFAVIGDDSESKTTSHITSNFIIIFTIPSFTLTLISVPSELPFLVHNSVVLKKLMALDFEICFSLSCAPFGSTLDRLIKVCGSWP
jgi:hypothetical protein